MHFWEAYLSLGQSSLYKFLSVLETGWEYGKTFIRVWDKKRILESESG